MPAPSSVAESRQPGRPKNRRASSSHGSDGMGAFAGESEKRQRYEGLGRWDLRTSQRGEHSLTDRREPLLGHPRIAGGRLRVGVAGEGLHCAEVAGLVVRDGEAGVP